jgi:hypothetical protein
MKKGGGTKLNLGGGVIMTKITSSPSEPPNPNTPRVRLEHAVRRILASQVQARGFVPVPCGVTCA